MEITDYHAKYYAYELTRRYASDNPEKLVTPLLDAQVDLNPHQIEAALFAFKSPLSKGAILADEVGLGKTIEAGLLISQKWAERKRRILIIVPSSLRNQWNQELYEKFFISSTILESKSFNSIRKITKSNPFLQDTIVLCSYHFARSMADQISKVKWDLVVIDEAHRLRNVYKTSNKIAKAIYNAIGNYPKVLLTATPLQNSLLELYGLVSFIDEYTFGDLKSFKAQFAKLTSDDNFDDLKARIAPVCKRTLRRQVLEYIKFTNRIPITQEFIPTKEEQILYDHVSDYLRRDNLYALPSSQRQLITLILRKLLASSTFAIAGALNSLLYRLEMKLKDVTKNLKVDEDLAEDFEALGEITEEWPEDDEEKKPVEEITPAQIEAMRQEVADLTSFRDLAESITHNAKGKVLLTALKAGFDKARKLGAKEKAVIFTESRRTQNYLLSVLSTTEYKDRIVLFNGSNNDEKSKQIYKAWLEKFSGTERVTGSQTSDMRSALVDYFKNQAVIMLATEAAAEGINLQFCSLVINYDLPWNPQRIEQRIGRCHRYGQKYDVVVVNFLNKNNAADQRVYQILSEKFKLFSGVFGASDEVLGSIESGVDFEKRIAQIYQECRTPDEIQSSFDNLQSELDEQISEKMQTTRQKLLESFDEEVHEKLRVNLKESKEYLNKHENMLWELTKFSLKDYAEFIDGQTAFKLNGNPFGQDGIPTGLYKLGKNIEDAHLYRMGHPLAQGIIANAKKPLSGAELNFTYSNHPLKISVLDTLIGKAGNLSISCLSVESFQAEDYLILCGVTDNGMVLDEEQCKRLFSLPTETVTHEISIEQNILDQMTEKRKAAIIEGIASKNTVYFEEELDKLDKWADDRRKSLKINLKDLDDKIKEVKKEARLAPNLPDKLKLQKQVKNLESKRDTAWLEYKNASKEIEDKKDELINNIENRLNQKISLTPLFSIRWRVT